MSLLGGGAGGGFFGSGGKNSTTTSDTRVTNQSQGVEGDNASVLASSFNLGNVGGGKNSTTNLQVSQTDFGAIGSAFGFGGRAFDAAVDISDNAVALGRSSLDSAENAYEGALHFGRDALDRVADSADSDRGFLANVFDDSNAFARGVFGDALETVTGVLSEGQAQLGNTVTTLNQIARQQSTTEAERVQDIASQALKIGAVMVGLIAAAIIFSRARA